MLINVLDYPSVQAALTAARNGDRVYMPSLSAPQPNYPGPAYQAPAGGWVIDKTLEIFGDGTGDIDLDTGTTIRPDNVGGVDDTVFTIKAKTQFPHLHDLKIRGSAAARGTKHAIYCDATAGIVNALRIERVIVKLHSGDGFHLVGGANSYIDGMTLTDCNAGSCRGAGFWLDRVTDGTISTRSRPATSKPSRSSGCGRRTTRQRARTTMPTRRSISKAAPVSP